MFLTLQCYGGRSNLAAGDTLEHCCGSPKEPRLFPPVLWALEAFEEAAVKRYQQTKSLESEQVNNS